MQKFNINGEFVNIGIYSELEYSITKELQKIFLSYLQIENSTKKEDYKICIFNSNHDIQYTDSLNGYDIFISQEKKIIYTVLPKEYSKDSVIYIKRLIESLRNRILESKGAVFFHGSAVSINNKAAIFVGKKNVGKTTALLNYLSQNNDAKYMSNDRVALIRDNDKIKVIGSPTNLSVRLKTLEKNKKFRGNLTLEEMKKLKVDSQDRFIFSVYDVKKNLDVGEKTSSNLEWVFCFDFEDKNKKSFREINYSEAQKFLEDNVINGVFEKNRIIDKTINVDRNNLSDLFDNNIIKFYERKGFYPINFNEILKNEIDKKGKENEKI
ncbi:MAG: hypothetical protein Q4G05_02095 [Clostridia bacterium]|nr:hypothetical protein [Clostridia bacterium]